MLQVLGRVRRLLSVQEPPDLRPPRPTFKRHSSDATGSFFPDFRYLLADMSLSSICLLYVFCWSFWLPSRLHPGVESMAPPSSLVMPPSSMDTLSILKEVSSNPPSPESSPSAVFPRLVISPPLFGDVCYNEDSSGNLETAKPHNGLDPSPTEEASGLATPRWFTMNFLLKVPWLSSFTETYSQSLC